MLWDGQFDWMKRFISSIKVSGERFGYDICLVQLSWYVSIGGFFGGGVF